MTSIFFRLDADNIIGFGHLYRCIELAKRSIEKGLNPVFILKFQTKSVLKIINSNEIKYELLDSKDEISSLKEIDSLIFLKKKYNSQFIFLDIEHKRYKDSPTFYKNYLTKIDLYFYTIMIGDFAPIHIYPKIMIIPYVGAKKYYPKLKVHDGTLLGEKYFVLRKEFLSNRNTYSFRKNVSIITISMGGSNPCSSIEKAIEAVISTSFSGKCIIIVGNNAKLNLTKSHHEKINISAIEFNFIYNSYNFISHLLDADIVITNSGLTKYETMFLGIPTFTFSINSEHEKIMNSFEKETNSIIHTGDINNISTTKISTELEKFLYDYKKREAFSLLGKKVIDGNGTSRILSYVIREINENGK